MSANSLTIFRQNVHKTFVFPLHSQLKKINQPSASAFHNSKISLLHVEKSEN